MISRILAVLVVCMLFLPAFSRVAAQTGSAQSGTAAGSVRDSDLPSASRNECNGGPCDDQQPRIIVSVPPPSPAPWRWQDRVSWASSLVLALFAYIGIMLALSTLRKIERQTRVLEAAVESARDQSQAAMLAFQAIVDAERPWVSIAIEASPTVKDGFHIVASNRGRSPAEIVDIRQQIAFAADESQLPAGAEFRGQDDIAPFLPLVLLPGESTTVKAFSREEVGKLCGSEEKMRRVANWDDKLFLMGKIVYRDLIARSAPRHHETGWCCWYIHGRQKSGMVFVGAAELNQRT